jgi:hypothetical protein
MNDTTNDIDAALPPGAVIPRFHTTEHSVYLG